MLLDYVDDELRIYFNFLVGLVLVVLLNSVSRDVVRNLCFLREDVQSKQRGTVRLTLLALVKIFDEPWVTPNLLDRVPFLRICIQNL